jgi:predicted HicB family RNase H-like nuclease
MDNKRRTPNRKLKAQLNVRVSEELLRRVNAVAGAMGKTLANFVSETLDERTKEHKADVERIAEREKAPKKWQ